MVELPNYAKILKNENPKVRSYIRDLFDDIVFETLFLFTMIFFGIFFILSMIALSYKIFEDSNDATFTYFSYITFMTLIPFLLTYLYHYLKACKLSGKE